jgi:diguanylate cyclase (GGDEF)-like protein
MSEALPASAPPFRDWRIRVRNWLGPTLPPQLNREFTQELGKYFLPFLVGGAVAISLGLAVSFTVGSSLAIAMAVVAVNGFLLVVLACWTALSPLRDNQIEAVESRYAIGIFLASAGQGGMVLAVFAANAPMVLQALLVMVALATLGVGNGSGPGRPVATLAQSIALGVPTALATLIYWPTPWNIDSFIGIAVYAIACVVLSLRSYAAQSQLLITREEQRNERLRINTALQHLNQPMVLLDENLSIVLINQSARTLLGLPADDGTPLPSFPELMATAPALVRASGDRDEFLSHAALLVAARQPFTGVLRLNDDRTIDLEGIPVPGAGWVAMLRDTTGERNAIAELNRELRRCSLTGLPNKRAFGEELERRLARDDRFTLLLIDLDGFKLVNERHGQTVGDRMITRIGFRLRTADPNLVVARLPGDKFAVILPGACADQAISLARSLIETIDTPARFGDAEVSVGAAVGIAMAPDHAMLAEGLQRAADLALRDAKSEPGNQIRLYHGALSDDAALMAKREAQVRAVIRNNQVDVAFQPMLDMASGRVVAVEALVRMPAGAIDPETPIDSNHMVAIAEARGLISQLRRQVFRKAAATVAALPSSIGLWVNVSVSDLKSPEVVDEILADIAAAGIDHHRIAIEITETALMTDETASLANLQRLVAMGSGVAMDDFGSGFSSLERLGRLPINAVKISGSLLTGATANPMAASIFRAAASLGQSLGVLLVAEGVETAAELELARTAGIARAQGFLLSQPVPAAGLMAAINAAEAAAANLARAA